jgi:hypothetical protein
MNFPLPSSSIPLNSKAQQKHSIPSVKKHPRVTAQLRDEILKLKANKPTVFVWEIQQTLLQNGICTAQTLPRVNSKIFQIIHLKFFSSSLNRLQIFNVF